jgi:hypothetical protein
LPRKRERRLAVPLFTLADLKGELAVLSAKGRQIEPEAPTIRYVAELIGSDTDSDPVADRVMVSCCDPLAIALTAAALMATLWVPA